MRSKPNRVYTKEQREEALILAKEVGLTEAARRLGYSVQTVSFWRNGRKAKVTTTVAPIAAPAVEPEASTPVANKPDKKAPTVAKFYSPSLKAKVLEYVAEHGITAASRHFSVTRFSIYQWKRRVKLHAQGGAAESPLVGSEVNPAKLRDERILKEWKSSTGLGPSQVRNQLRRQGLKVSIHTVRCVLEQHGYVTPKVRRDDSHDQRFEAVRPNQLWHLDFLHRHINKQKVYILVILDDFSRFIVGGAIWDGERVAAVIETFSAAVARHGKPEKALSDGGSAFHAWRGVGQFTNCLTEMEVDQIIAQNPETNGKLEALNANLHKEVFNPEKFFDLGETQRRFSSWISFYNLRRTHTALGGLLVPADRYYGRADEVLACIESGGTAGVIGEPAAVGDRHLDLFRVSSHRGQVELYLMGQRIPLPPMR